MLRIHILRNDLGPDDIITVRKNMSGDFVVTYADHETNIRYMFHASRENLLEYLWGIFNFLRIDEEPFEKVQIVSPVHPSIMLKVKNLTDRKVGNIMWSLRNVIYNWPQSLAASFA